MIAKNLVKAAYMKDKKKAPRCTSQKREEMYERLKDGKSSLYRSNDRKENSQDDKILNNTFKEIIAMNNEKQKEGKNLQLEMKEYKLKLNKSY